MKERAYADFLWLHDLCAEAVAGGVLREISPALLFPLIVQMADGIIDLAGSGCPGMTTEEIIDAGLLVIWHGIGARGAE